MSDREITIEVHIAPITEERAAEIAEALGLELERVADFRSAARRCFDMAVANGHMPPFPPSRLGGHLTAEEVNARMAAACPDSWARPPEHQNLRCMLEPLTAARLAELTEPCPDCRGSGEYVGLLERRPCPTCRGGEA